MIRTKGLAVGLGKSFSVYVGQGDFENDCMKGSNGRHCSTHLAIFLLGQRLPNLPCNL